jgi:hypothetical protein
MDTSKLIHNEYVKFIRPIVEHFDDVLIQNNEIICYSTISSVYNQMKSPPPSISTFVLAKFNCINPLSREETLNMLALVLPFSAPRGMKCADLLTLDYEANDIFGHHRDTMLNISNISSIVDIPGDYVAESAPLVLIVVISIVGFLSAIIVFITVRFVRNRAKSGKEALTQLDKVPQEVLSKCKVSETLLGSGGEAEVFLAEIIVDGKVRQIASKMYYDSDMAKAEFIFYEGLPFHQNILKVFGIHVEKKTKRWSIAMEYCRQGNMR